MSHEALINDLRQKSRERIKQFRIQAEAKAEELRSQKEKEYEQSKIAVDGQLKAEVERVASPILHKAECSALTIGDEAMRRLSERMFVLAKQKLDQIRQHDYETIFSKLVEEIPDVRWEGVLVNPVDTVLAKRYFSGCEIRTDSTIIGGFIASTEDGRYQVVNTLQRRLEKGWPVIFTEMLKEIMEKWDA